jgi:predicted metal-dependent phosphoesterase TrpH
MMGTKRRTTKLDMHLHTPTSDGYGSPAEYVKAIQKAGLDGIVITDHHITKSREKPASLKVATAVREAGFICLHGCEYSSAQGHVLVYGVDIDTLKLGRYEELQEVIWRAREEGGVAFPSHPYHGYKKRCADHLFKLQDLVAVEGWNGQLEVRDYRQRENEKAVEAAQKLSIPVVGNSDAHIAYRIGTCYTEFDGLVRRNGDLVEALLDDAPRFRPVVNRRKVAEQRKAGWYSSRSLWGSSLDKGGKTPYQSPYASGQGSFWSRHDPVRLPPIFEEEDRQIRSFDEAFEEFDAATDDFEPIFDIEIEDEDIPEHAFHDQDLVSDDPSEVQAYLARQHKRRR